MLLIFATDISAILAATASVVAAADMARWLVTTQAMHDIDEKDHSAWKLSLSCGAETFSSLDPASSRDGALLERCTLLTQLTGELFR